MADVATDAAFHPLIPFLEMAVPLWIADLQRRPCGGPDEHDRKLVREFADVLGEKGDILLHGYGKYRQPRGEPGPGKLAGQLAQAVAVAAFCPGGIQVLGLHFEAGVSGVESEGTES